MNQPQRTDGAVRSLLASGLWLLGALSASGQQCPGLKPSFMWANEGSAIVFTDLTEGEISDRMWYFGDGDSASGASVTHVYAFADVDTVRLTFWSMGCAFEVEGVVAHGGESDACDSQISSTFLAEQLWNNTLGFEGQDQGDGSPMLHFWAYGDDSISFIPVDTHFYALPGAYDVTHSIATLDSLFQTACVAGSVQRVFVDGNTSTCDSSVFLDLSAALDGNMLLANANTVFFDEGLILLGWWWSYGDNSSDITSGPGMEHIYPYGGEYQVCVEVQVVDSATSDSCYALACTTVFALPDVSLEEAVSPAAIRARPVPCGDEVWIEGSVLEPGNTWRLLDALGRETRVGTFKQEQNERLDMTGLPIGVYTLIVSGDDRIVSLHLLKQ